MTMLIFPFDIFPNEMVTLWRLGTTRLPAHHTCVQAARRLIPLFDRVLVEKVVPELVCGLAVLPMRLFIVNNLIEFFQ